VESEISIFSHVEFNSFFSYPEAMLGAIEDPSFLWGEGLEGENNDRHCGFVAFFAFRFG
jgi:hypothetical protein